MCWDQETLFPQHPSYLVHKSHFTNKKNNSDTSFINLQHPPLIQKTIILVVIIFATPFGRTRILGVVEQFCESMQLKKYFVSFYKGIQTWSGILI